jgi:non-ribosomal peptide synthetase component F
MGNRPAGMTRRGFLATTAAMSAATLLGPGDRLASAQGAKPTITFWNGLTGADGKVMGELIEDRAARNGDRVFLRFKDQKFTYNEMNRFANRCANALTDRRVVKGDKIAIMLPNCPEFIHLWLGSAKIGAVEVPINTSYKGEYLRHIVDQSD